MGLKVGDLVRWVIDHEIIATGEPETFEVTPIYSRGIIVDVSSSDSNSVIIACFGEGGFVIRHMLHDGFEIMSGG
mgnify:CR=1 FL=1